MANLEYVFGFLGIQFGFALQNGNVNRIFQTLGASIDDIPILWIADKCGCGYGFGLDPRALTPASNPSSAA